jgi:methyltransferase
MLPLVLFVLAFGPMALESRRSRAHDRTLRALGAREPRDDVYRLMQVVYPACFLAMIAEAWLRGRTINRAFVAGAVLFAGAKLVKYWAIATLGPRWTFRVLVPPAATLVTSGPYRFMRHPNYLGVAGELLGMAVMAQAPVTGALSVVSFGALLLARIRVEERALGRTGGN